MDSHSNNKFRMLSRIRRWANTRIHYLIGDAIPSKNRPTSKEAIVNKAGKVSQAALAVAQTSPSKPIVRSATKAGEAYKSGSENVAQMYVDNGLGGFENH